MENQDKTETRPSSEQNTVSENNSPDTNISGTTTKRKSAFHPKKFQAQLKLFNTQEQEWLKSIIENKIPIFIRDHEGKDIENLLLLAFEADEGRSIECEQAGQKIKVSKINCVFIGKMEQKQQIQDLSKPDEKKLPRLTYQTSEGEERWLFPQTETLIKMNQNLGGIFILADRFMYRGRVYWFTRWNLFLSIAKGCEIFIFKHACMRWSVLFKKKFSNPSRFSSEPREGKAPQGNNRPPYPPKRPSEPKK